MLFWSSVVAHYPLHEEPNTGTEPSEETKQKIVDTVSNSFPTVEGNEEDCPVCLESPENAKMLPCNHKFCTPCLSKWLVRNKNCPTCRHVVDIHFEYETAENDGLPDFWFVLIRDLIIALRESDDVTSE